MFWFIELVKFLRLNTGANIFLNLFTEETVLSRLVIGGHYQCELLVARGISREYVKYIPIYPSHKLMKSDLS
jgi:hypothetical protein